ncbi:MAG: beta-ketoacyl-[acyl-carrier-protein] synthase family protein [Cyanobacteria bacterium P01_A01_bin.84]
MSSLINPSLLDKPKIVVTGISVISTIGIGVDNFWKALLAGKIGIYDINRFDTSEFLTHKGGEVRNFCPSQYITKFPYDELPLSTQFAVAVTKMAMKDADLLESCSNSERIGVVFGTVMGNKPALEPIAKNLHMESQELISVFIPNANAASDTTLICRAPAIELGLFGPNMLVSTACAAGNSAITYAMDTISSGRADVMIAGGTDELSISVYMMFNKFSAIAPDSVQPFDKNRKGLIPSEGAGALVLESYEHAKKRGAFIYGEVCGHGNFADAHHMTAPHPEGLGAIRSMETALKMSGFSPEEVDYISAHGTGTPLNDAIESKAINTVFSNITNSISVSSIKGMLGHTHGASGVIESASCLLAIRDNIVPHNANYEEPDPECQLNIVTGTPRHQKVRVALNNAFGFGGNTSCVVFSQLDTSRE